MAVGLPSACRMLALAVAAPLAGAALAAGTPQVVGIAAAIVNDVRISYAQAPQPRPMAVRQRVALADQIQTGRRSQLQIMLLDRSTFTVGANARLTIDRFVYDPATGRSFGASVAKGAFRFMSGRRDGRSNGSVNSPVASIGIRGTIVDGVVGAAAADIASREPAVGRNVCSDRETATLVVLRGPGARTQANLVPGGADVSAAGHTVALDRPMLAAYVPRPGVPPIGPFTISPGGLSRVQDQVSPVLAQWRRSQGGLGGLLRSLPINIGIGGGGGGSSGRDGRGDPGQGGQQQPSNPNPGKQ